MAQRRLPLPVCSDRFSSSKWLGGSVESPRAPFTPPVGHLTKSCAASRQLSGTMRQPQSSVTYFKPLDRSPASSQAPCLSSGRNNIAVTERVGYSPPKPLHTSPYRASKKTVMNRSRSPLRSGNASQDDKFTTDKKSKHRLTKQVFHTVVERERRRKCSEIIMTMKTHFLPDLLADVSSNSHKSIVPRNIVLEYSLAHIVCLPRKCGRLQRKCDLLQRKCDRLQRRHDLLDRDYKELLQKRERNWHPLGKEEDRPRPQCPTGQPQLDSLRDPSPDLDSRDTPPTSSPSSPATCKQTDPEVSGNETENQASYRSLRRSSDSLQALSNGSTTWQSDVAGEIREFVEKRKEAYRETEEIRCRKRKRSSSDVTVTAERP